LGRGRVVALGLRRLPWMTRRAQSVCGTRLSAHPRTLCASPAAQPQTPPPLNPKPRHAKPRPLQTGVAFKESIIPRAVEWFTGEAAPPMYEDEEGEGGDDEFEQFMRPGGRQ
jgi:hypothetical protein